MGEEIGFRVAQRCLGDSVRGPAVGDFAGNFKLAKQFFTRGAVSYAEYKAQCVALRVFAFGATTGGCVLSLYLNPPQSSYWQRISPSYALYAVANHSLRQVYLSSCR